MGGGIFEPSKRGTSALHAMGRGLGYEKSSGEVFSLSSTIHMGGEATAAGIVCMSE